MSGPPPLPDTGPPPVPRFAPPRTQRTGMNPGVIIAVVIGSLFAGLFFIAIVAAIALPAMARAREAAQRAECQGHLKQIGFCCKLFANEHNNQLPKNLGDIYPEYLTTPEALTCPSSEDVAGSVGGVDAWSSYEIVYSGAEENRADIIIAREKNEHAHMPAGRNCLFGDGHVEFRRAGVTATQTEPAP